MNTVSSAAYSKVELGKYITDYLRDRIILM